MPNCLRGLGSSSWSVRRLSFPAFHRGDGRADSTTEKLRGRSARAASLARARSPHTRTPPALRRSRTVAPYPLACTRTARASGRTSSSSPRTRSGPPGMPSASSACAATSRPSASRYLPASAARDAVLAPIEKLRDLRFAHAARKAKQMGEKRGHGIRGRRGCRGAHRFRVAMHEQVVGVVVVLAPFAYGAHPRHVHQSLQLLDRLRVVGLALL